MILLVEHIVWPNSYTAISPCQIFTVLSDLDESRHVRAEEELTVELWLSLLNRESDLVKDGVSSNPSAEEQDLMIEEAQKMSSVLPTMWLGAQNGW